jgi:hypothetical protein
MTARSEVWVIVVVAAFEVIVALPAVTVPPAGAAAAGLSVARQATMPALRARLVAVRLVTTVVFTGAAG